MKYFTTPIYYANGKPHIGHLYSTLIADVLKKTNELLGKESFFLSGMDEHGQKVQETAKKNGQNPKDYVDNISAEFLSFFDYFTIKTDSWVRTTSCEHKEAVAHFWNILQEKGFIYKSKYEGWYSVRDEAYYTNDEVTDGKGPTGAEVTWMEEECYYFKLSAFEKPLLKFYEENPDFIYPKKRQNEAMGFLKQGLKDFAVSRPKSRVSWGIEVPGDSDQTIYVWIDALVNYLTAAGYPDESYKEKWPAMHILGKDILKFHGVYWPAMLMAADIEMPKKMIVHGWWLNKSEKISHSLDHAIDLYQLAEHYKSDSVRYFLASSINIGEDGDFSHDLFKKIYLSDLANNLGNTFLRVLGLYDSKFDLKTPEKSKKIKNKYSDLILETKKMLEELSNDITLLPKYTNKVLECIKSINAYLHENKPWEETDEEILKNTMYFLLDNFKKIALLIYPIMPNISKIILDFFQLPIDMKSFDGKLKEALRYEEKPVLFPR